MIKRLLAIVSAALLLCSCGASAAPKGTIGIIGAMDKEVNALRGEKIAAVVDNFQSSSELGPALARELRLPRIVLSNFPMTGTREEGDYLSLLASPARKLGALPK